MSYSNQLVSMAREILAIEADLPYRLDYADERPTIDDFELNLLEENIEAKIDNGIVLYERLKNGR